MLLLLQARGRVPAPELATHLEVSTRTVYRDVDALSSAGIPVHAERGVRGGIVLADGYRRALTQLDEDEIRALFIAGDNPLADIGFDGRPKALEKLAGALPAAQRRAIEMTRSRIYVDQRRWRQAAQPREHLAALRVAIWEDRRVLLRYKDRNQKSTERTIEPLGLVAKAGIWYVVARAGADMRTFRAERILAVSETAEHFERPAGFDLMTFWREWTARFEESVPAFPVILRVSADVLADITEFWQSQVIEHKQDEPNALVRIVFPSEDAAVHQLVAWSSGVDVIEPVVLRGKVVDCARAALARYA